MAQHQSFVHELEYQSGRSASGGHAWRHLVSAMVKVLDQVRRRCGCAARGWFCVWGWRTLEAILGHFASLRAPVHVQVLRYCAGQQRLMAQLQALASVSAQAVSGGDDSGQATQRDAAASPR